MRYFKCESLKPEDREMITQYVSLTEEDKKRDRQGKLLNFVAIALCSIVFLVEPRKILCKKESKQTKGL